MPSPTSHEHHDPDAELQDALNDIAAVLPVSGKSQRTQAEQHVRRICSIAYEHGLSDEHLDSVIDMVIESNGLSQTSLDNMVNHLYPAGKVSDGVVCKVVGSLGQGTSKASPQVQAGLVKWLIMTHDILSDRRILSRLYGTLFNLLDMISLRKPLCHLLAIITRRKHVKPFRIQMLLELSRNFSYEPALGGLIRVYKDYYPDIILGSVTYGRALNFSLHPNQEWQTRLLAIQKSRASEREDILTERSGFKVFRSGTHSTVVPEVHTSHANEKSITFEEVDNVNDFVNKLDKLELPNQVISVLHDPLLQKYLSIRPSESSSKRIHHWLVTFFEEELELIQEGQTASERLGVLLESILSYTHYTKTLLPACERFLELYLTNWDGVQYREVILALITYVSSLRRFEDLQTQFFDPIETAILDGTPTSKMILLEFYTALLHNWAVQHTSQSSSTSPSSTNPLTLLIEHLNTLALSLYESTSTTTASLHQTIPSILSLYILLSSTLPPTIPIILPPTQLIHLLLFHPFLSTLSGLCTILTNYKRALESSFQLTKKPQQQSLPPPRQLITTFNSLIADTINCLWRSRAFENQTQPQQNQSQSPPPIVPPSILPKLQAYLAQQQQQQEQQSYAVELPALFSLSLHPVFARISKVCMDEIEAEAQAAARNETGTETGMLVHTVTAVRHPSQPVTQTSLALLAEKGGVRLSWGEFRVRVLRYLNRRGVTGVGNLVRSVMKGVDLGSDGGGGGAAAAAGGEGEVGT